MRAGQLDLHGVVHLKRQVREREVASIRKSFRSDSGLGQREPFRIEPIRTWSKISKKTRLLRYAVFQLVICCARGDRRCVKAPSFTPRMVAKKTTLVAGGR